MNDRKTYRARLTLDVPMKNSGTDLKTDAQIAADMVVTFMNLLKQEPETFGKYFKVTDIEEVVE